MRDALGTGWTAGFWGRSWVRGGELRWGGGVVVVIAVLSGMAGRTLGRAEPSQGPVALFAVDSEGGRSAARGDPTRSMP
jgi:hypothetical protein